jgi:2-enoate reductase
MKTGAQFEHLLQPLQIGKLTIKNRFCAGPIGTPAQHSGNGEYNDNGIEHFVVRAKGGFGLIFSGCLIPDMEIDYFTASDSISPLYNPANFRRTALLLNERVSHYSTVMFAQLSMGVGRNHPGSYAPSELPVFSDPDLTSPVLTRELIRRKIEIVVQAASLMKSSGFAGVEIHAMHWGYLLDEFAMCITNKRTDEYGGRLENRLRAAREILEGVKQTCGCDFPVSMRLGLKSYVKGFNKPSVLGDEEAGRTPEEAIEIAKMLESFGYDVLSVDAGIYDNFAYCTPPMYLDEGFLLNMAKQVRDAVRIPVLTGGCRLGDPYLCERAIADGKTDGVVLGRAVLADPDIPLKTMMGVPKRIRPCIACNQGCTHLLLKGCAPTCAINPISGRRQTYGLSAAWPPKKIAVVGGGVAGMEAARTAKLRGHDVRLYEKSDKLGGLLIAVAAHRFKKSFAKLNEWYRRELKELEIPVYLNTQVTADFLKTLDVDAAIISMGSTPTVPDIPGIDGLNVCTCVDALLGKHEIGGNVAIIGGRLPGCEIAVEYAAAGKNVTIVESLGDILPAYEEVPLPNSVMLRGLLEHNKVRLITAHRVKAVNNVEIVIGPSDGNGEIAKIPADTVIIAIGFKPIPGIEKELYGSEIEVYRIGDGRRVGNIMGAVGDAYEIARTI